MSHVFGTESNNVELVSVSCSSRSSDLISGDESETQSPDSRTCSPAMTIPTPIGFEESVMGLVKDEKRCVLGWEYASRLESEPQEASAREESIAWIRKVAAFYGFQPLTAYLSISYLDRFLSALQFPETNGWPYQLLSVACLSLAAKMEELLVPSLIDLQMEGVVTKNIFEPKTVQRMELLVLSVMGWRLRSITPFNFLAFFAYKLDPNGRYCDFLSSQASDIILAAVSDARILQYRPSCIAAAAILSVANIIQGLSHVDSEIAELWCDGLSGEKIIACCGILQDAVLNKLPMQIGHETELHSSSQPSKTSRTGRPVRVQSTLEEQVK
uniref:Uncharacterized protein n=1 Tax=Kalanchoe fedtschenkoi TaxID=63787 RepID=A0A7N0T7B3_KALFE